MDYKEEIVKEIERIPDNLLQRVYELIQKVIRHREQVDEVLRKAEEISKNQTHLTRAQRLDHLLKVMDEIREQAVHKGVAVEREEEAVFDGLHFLYAVRGDKPAAAGKK